MCSGTCVYSYVCTLVASSLRMEAVRDALLTPKICKKKIVLPELTGVIYAVLG